MSYLLDTNVISEFSKRRPNPAITGFVTSLPPDETWLSVMSLGEIRRGVEIELARNPASAELIRQWLMATEEQFVDRLLPVTGEIAHRWGEISADRTRPVVDTLLAATALVHDLIVVTRNERDFANLGVRLINPWG